MAFIEAIPDSDIDDDVRAMYERQQTHYGYVPNYAKVFCYRPELMRLWAHLQAGIKHHMDKRRFELVTFAAAHALRSTLCSLAHGKALTEFFSREDVQAMARLGDLQRKIAGLENVPTEFAKYADNTIVEKAMA